MDEGGTESELRGSSSADLEVEEGAAAGTRAGAESPQQPPEGQALSGRLSFSPPERETGHVYILKPLGSRPFVSAAAGDDTTCHLDLCPRAAAVTITSQSWGCGATEQPARGSTEGVG